MCRFGWDDIEHSRIDLVWNQLPFRAPWYYVVVLLNTGIRPLPGSQAPVRQLYEPRTSNLGTTLGIE